MLSCLTLFCSWFTSQSSSLQRAPMKQWAFSFDARMSLLRVNWPGSKVFGHLHWTWPISWRLTRLAASGSHHCSLLMSLSNNRGAPEKRLCLHCHQNLYHHTLLARRRRSTLWTCQFVLFLFSAGQKLIHLPSLGYFHLPELERSLLLLKALCLDGRPKSRQLESHFSN